MLQTELSTAQIPEIYKRFSGVVGACHWKKRASCLKQDIKRNPLLREYLQSENTIALQLEHLRLLSEKYGGIPPVHTQDRDVYPAASFAAQILSIMDSVTAKQTAGLSRRIHGAIKNPEDTRAMRLELTAATHFARRGHKIEWPEQKDEDATFDLLVKDLDNQLSLMQDTTLAEGTTIKITGFDPASLGYKPGETTPRQIRTALDDVTSTKNRSGLIIGTPAGGVLVLTLQSKDDDNLLKTVFDELSKSANKQLTGKRAAIFVVGFDELDGEQLLSIASQDQDPNHPPTGLQLAESKFLSKQNRENLVGVGFLSGSSLLPVSDNLQQASGTAYFFPKKETSFWHADFSGIFSVSK